MRWKLAVALVLGLVGVFVYFFVSEGRNAPGLFDADYARSAERVACMAGWFFVAAALVTRKTAHVLRDERDVLVLLDGPFVLLALVAAIVERDVETPAFAAIVVGASLVGASVAARIVVALRPSPR